MLNYVRFRFFAVFKRPLSHRILTRVNKDHPAFRDVMVRMGITDYQAATDEMAPKERRAWQVPLDHAGQIPIIGTGNSARGGIWTIVILV